MTDGSERDCVFFLSVRDERALCVPRGRKEHGQHRKGQYELLAPNYRQVNHSLDYEQEQAVKHILSSRDFVTLFRGGAGTGKSFTLREVKAGLARARQVVHVLAPQRQQVADLERDGFTGAQTVSAFLTQKAMRRGAVVLVDEAGQIGGEQMLQLLDYVQINQGRIILSGDTRQHGAVEASDALRAIEMYSGLALQDRCVEFIKPLPERYASLAGDEVSVKAIEIEDEKERG